MWCLLQPVCVVFSCPPELPLVHACEGGFGVREGGVRGREGGVQGQGGGGVKGQGGGGQGEGGVRGRERGKGPQVFAEPWSSPDRGDGWAGPPPGAVRSAATEAVRLGTSSVVAARREVDKGATGGGGACVVQDMRAHGATWCCGVKGAGYKACVVKAMHAHGATWC